MTISGHFSQFMYCCKNCNVCLKKAKNKLNRGRNDPFKRKSAGWDKIRRNHLT